MARPYHLINCLLLVFITMLFSTFASAEEYVEVQILCPNGKPIVEGYNTDTQMNRDIAVYLGSSPNNKKTATVAMPSGTIKIPREWLGKYVVAQTEGTEWDGYCTDAFPQNHTEWETRPFILKQENRPVVMSLEKITR